MKPIAIYATAVLAILPAAHSFLGVDNNPLIHYDLPTTPQKKLTMAGDGADATSKQRQQLQRTVILSDVMPRDKSISIFASLSRQVETAERRLDDGERNTTVLAPLNSAVEALPRKPWEDPEDAGGDTVSGQKYAGQDGFEQAQKNLQRFVEAHFIRKSPWREGEKCKTVGEGDGGTEVWWEEKDGKRIVSACSGELLLVGSVC